MTPTRCNIINLFGLLILAICSTTIPRVSAQTAFTWGPGITATSLRECNPLQLSVAPLPGQTLNPPFYMIAYEPGGPTTSTTIGSNPLNLTWVVDHAAGSQVILQVVDAKGNSGGVGPHVYPVNAGIPGICRSTSPPTIKLASNATTLQTCDFLLLDITGGVKPYIVSVASINGHGAINATMGPNDDEYLWVNRANPNGDLVVVISDASGQYSNTSPLITTTGPKDVTCGNLQSQSRIKGSASGSPSSTHASSPTQSSRGSKTTSSSASTSATAGAGAAGGHKSSGGLVGGVVGGLGAALALVTFGFFFLRKRRRPSYADDVYAGGAKPDPFNPADESFGNRVQNSARNGQTGQMSEHGDQGYGRPQGADARPSYSSANYKAPLTPDSVVSAAGGYYENYEMTPATSMTRLTDTMNPPTVRSPPPPPGAAPPLIGGYAAAATAATVNPWHPPHSTSQNIPPSLQAGGPSPQHGSSPVPHPRGVMLVDRVPNTMRSLQPGQPQTPDRNSPSTQQQQSPQAQGYVPPHLAYNPYNSQPSPQRGATPTTTEPASVLYAKSRASTSTALSTGSHTSSHSHQGSQSQPRQQLPQSITRLATNSQSTLRVPKEAEEPEDEETLLAYYRTSVASSDDPAVTESSAASYPTPFKAQVGYPQPLKPLAQSSAKGGEPSPKPEPRIHQHEDGGPVLEVPPAYRDQYDDDLPPPK